MTVFPTPHASTNATDDRRHSWCVRRWSYPKIEELPLDLPQTMYQGLEFTEAEMEAAARSSRLPYPQMANPADEVGELLADGKIIETLRGSDLDAVALGPFLVANSPMNNG